MQMTLEKAQTVVNKMAKDRYTTVEKVIDEYNRHQKNGEAQHFWPIENTACRLIILQGV